ncbi:hypothetical protein WR25_14980 [Diploscapter pachys]|uniref:Uncharacterized protein n=1 Tax=Diploscapter pachys TaxID=2018661 RepID=A0A2A2M3S8_9BILA|nr:hypothetical protein WR25_14980 [Diploscapter pachys]
MSSVSLASRASSAARSSASLRVAMPVATASRKPLIRGPSTWRSSGLILPSVFSSVVTLPCLPSASTRTASSASRLAADSIAAISWPRRPLLAHDGGFHRGVYLIPDEDVDAVCLGEAGDQALAMLDEACEQV